MTLTLFRLSPKPFVFCSRRPVSVVVAVAHARAHFRVFARVNRARDAIVDMATERLAPATSFVTRYSPFI